MVWHILPGIIQPHGCPSNSTFPFTFSRRICSFFFSFSFILTQRYLLPPRLYTLFTFIFLFFSTLTINSLSLLHFLFHLLFTSFNISISLSLSIKPSSLCIYLYLYSLYSRNDLCIFNRDDLFGLWPLKKKKIYTYRFTGIYIYILGHENNVVKRILSKRISKSRKKKKNQRGKKIKIKNIKYSSAGINRCGLEKIKKLHGKGFQIE